MQETPLKVQVSKDVTLQASIYSPKMREDNSIMCIITHPYSRWGGSMHNNVVVGVRNYLVNIGYSCIAFNFRGVGDSTGVMGNGTQEIEDIKGVYSYVQDQLNYKHIIIIGYSYGGLISLAAAPDMKDLDAMCLISYPAGFVNHLLPSFTVSFPILFIHGEHDSIIPVSRVQQLFPKFSCKTSFKLISTDHFYNGKEKQVGIYIQNFIQDLQFG